MILKNIVNDLLNSSLSFQEIANKYNLDISMIYYINRGTYHTLPEINYPIRQVTDTSKKYYYCDDCGVEISKGATKCKECYNRSLRTCSWPNKEELKKLIRSIPFTQIGKKFSVTDNTIRKWCIKYNLPSKKKDIQSYSDEDWGKI